VDFTSASESDTPPTIDAVAIWYDAKGGPRAKHVEAITTRLDVPAYPIRSVAELETQLVSHINKRVIVVGGDGSVHQLLNAAHRTGTLDQLTFAVVPAGTGNDFARNIALPKSREECIDLALHGFASPIDLVIDGSDNVIVNSAHVGLGSVAVDRGAPLKPYVGKLSYTIGGFLAGLGNKQWALSVQVDGADMALPNAARTVLMAVVANAAHDGGGLTTTPGARIDDGNIHVMLATPSALHRKLAFSLGLMRGRHHLRNDCAVIAGKEILIVGTNLNWNDDGDPLVVAESRSFVVMTNAVRVVRPATT